VNHLLSGAIIRPIGSARIRALIGALLLSAATAPIPSAAADWRPLVERLAADGFDRPALEALFSRPECLFEPEAMAGKIRSLLRNRSADAESQAAALRETYRRSYLNSWAIFRAQSYLVENGSVLEEITAHYGVPKEIIVSILLIETHLGKNTGSWGVFNRLASMARSADLETVRPHLDAPLLTAENEEYARLRCREKAEWAYQELRALLRYAERENLDPLAIRGSIYGAIGLCQFMPSNVLSYGVDADRDGRTDPFAKPDALFSIANYLRGHGWREGMDRAEQRRVIFRYNHSTVYADTVLNAAEKLRDRNQRPRTAGEKSASD